MDGVLRHPNITSERPMQTPRGWGGWVKGFRLGYHVSYPQFLQHALCGWQPGSVCAPRTHWLLAAEKEKELTDFYRPPACLMTSLIPNQGKMQMWCHGPESSQGFPNTQLLMTAEPTDPAAAPENKSSFIYLVSWFPNSGMPLGGSCLESTPNATAVPSPPSPKLQPHKCPSIGFKVFTQRGNVLSWNLMGSQGER